MSGAEVAAHPELGTSSLAPDTSATASAPHHSRVPPRTSAAETMATDSTAGGASGSNAAPATHPAPSPPSADAFGAPSTKPAAPSPLMFPDHPEITRPYSFFPLSNNPRHSDAHELEPISDEVYVHPDDDPAAVRGIPVFKPTMEEFKDFERYMNSVRRWGERSSIIKIIPPKEWVDNVKLVDARALTDLQIKSPIEQRMVGQNGVFIQQNVERNRNRPFSIHRWFDKCQSHPDFVTPNPKQTELTLDRDSKEAKELQAQRAAEAKRVKLAKREERLAALQRTKERKERREREAEEAQANEPDAAPTPAADTPMEGVEECAESTHQDDLPGLETSSHTSHSTGEPLATTPEGLSIDPTEAALRAAKQSPAPLPIDPFYEATDLRTAWLPEGIQPEDYDVAACDKIERKFWKSLGTGKKDSWYGADLAGSLFADDKYPWNVAHLPNLLDRLPQKLPGVNSPYLYFGMYRAAFSWHVEDMDLYSINYIHFGAPKFWYAVPQTDAERFESIVRSYFPTDANACDQFMRHKSCTVSPFKLHAQGIRVNKLVQHQNEFVVTFPRGYHSGFNMGFNCAESVNFALAAWLEMGRKAKACTCVDFSVRIDVDKLLKPPSPPPEEEEQATPTPTPAPKPVKRKAEGDTPEGAPPRRRGRKPKVVKEEPALPSAPLPLPEVPKEITIKIPLIRIPTQPKPEVIHLSPTKPKHTANPTKHSAASSQSRPAFPCILCPSLVTDDLAPVWQPNDFIRSLARTPGVQAHVSCAVAVPEAFTDEVETDDGPVTYIKGLENIGKARWKLKCVACPDKQTAAMGTKIQCTKGKCIRAFHVPCARDNEEVLYFAGERQATVPIPHPPGVGPFDQPTVYEQTTEFVVELLCPVHNPEAVELRKRKAKEILGEKVHAIPIGAFVKVRINGASYQTQLLQVFDEAEKVEVRLPNLTTKEVPWTWLDFRPSEVALQENEYAGPPKRSRKDADSQPSRPAVFTTPVTSPTKAVSARGRTAVAATAAAATGASSPPPAQNPTQRPPPPPLTQPPPHTLPAFAPQNAGPYHHYPPPHQHPSASPHTFHPINSVVLVDSKNPHPAAEYHPHSHPHLPPPPHYHYHPHHTTPPPPPNYYHVHHPPPHGSHGPFGPAGAAPPHGPGPMVVDHMRGVAPAVVYGPRVAIPPARALGHSSPPQPTPPPMVMGYHQHRAVSQQAAGNGIPPVPPLPAGTRPSIPPPPGWAPSAGSSSTNSISQTLRQQSTIPGGVGKIDLGLDRMMKLMRELPPLTVPAIHLAGTNGKGSVSVLLEACINSAGLRTLRYNSPHLLEPRDAIRINGLPVSEEVYADAIRCVQEISDIRKLNATTFEIGTAAAYYIANMTSPQVDVMIIECGMGGARDATNVLPPNLVLASGLTSVGLDHTDRLGDTIGKIAREKASIAVEGGVLVLAPHLHPEARNAAHQVAAERRVNLIEAAPSALLSAPSSVSLSPFRAPAPMTVRTPLAGADQAVLDTQLALGGAHQLDNLSLALTILDVLRNNPRARGIQPKLSRLTDKAMYAGVASAKWQGRCSWVEWNDEGRGMRVPLLLDGAHNADSATTLRRYIDSLNIPGPRTYVLALSENPSKPPASVLAPLLRPGDRLAQAAFTTPVDGMPWISVADQGAVAAAAAPIIGKDACYTSPGSGPGAVADAIRWATQGGPGAGLTVVCGSLYLVADAYRLVGRVA